MSTDEQSSAVVPQRFERPLHVPPGFWKTQLPTKYLEVAAKGSLDDVKRLLAEHPDFLNPRGNHNRTLLWEAARRGKLDVVKWLAEQGADVTATGSYNNETLVQITPYVAAIYYRRADVADYLRSAGGAQLDIFRAAFLGDLERVSQALADAPDLLNAEDPHDWIYYVPLLAFAVRGGLTEVVEFLLHKGAIVTPYSKQLLGGAARLGRKDLIELLVRYGADVRTVGADIFVASDDLDILRYLLRHGASASRVYENGFTPLIYLARGDKGEHPEKIKLLLEHGAPVNAVGPKRRTAMHYAAVAGFVKVMKLLLEAGADPALQDESGATALSLAQAAGKSAAVSLLIERGAKQ